MTHSGQVTAGESDRPPATILSRRRAHRRVTAGLSCQTGLVFAVWGLVANLPRVKIIGRNDPKGMSDLRVLTVLGHLEEKPRPPPIFFWWGHRLGEPPLP